MQSDGALAASLIAVLASCFARGSHAESVGYLHHPEGILMTIELIPLGTADVGISPIMMPGGPSGTRAIIEVTSAQYTGERLRAKLKGVAAADWAVVSPTGIGLMDARLTIETEDGALIYVSYGGRVDLSAGMEGATVYTAPRFETGDERYAWMNKVQAVAKGVISGDVLRYELYELR